MLDILILIAQVLALICMIVLLFCLLCGFVVCGIIELREYIENHKPQKKYIVCSCCKKKRKEKYGKKKN